MNIHFYKYHGTGNDFIILDNRQDTYSALNTEQIHQLCPRHFGIGADGLMLFNTKAGYDFEMKYYNADGKEGSMCGNGGRCIVKFAIDMGLHQYTYRFWATDGMHEAELDNNQHIRLKMKDVNEVEEHNSYSVLNTGSPHFVKFADDVANIDVVETGRDIRNSKNFAEEGINVNFVEQLDNSNRIKVRTYERGVEDETYSCGTGVTAAALMSYHNETGFNDIEVSTLGGNLTVEFERSENDTYHNIWLCGPAERVFEGQLEIK